MNEYSFDSLPPEEQKRIDYIEGRSELFETKLLRFSLAGKDKTEKKKKLLVATRDPGSGNALVPVLKKLEDDAQIEIDVLTDGRAEEIIQNNFKTEDITSQKSALAVSDVIGNPKAILIDSSAEMGIESFMASTFPEVPKVLVGDWYSDVIPLLIRLKEKGFPFPEKICVMDNGARETILRKFPELEDRIEITGQPAFDRIANEDTQHIAAEVKNRLGLKPTDKLVTFMSTMDEPEKIRQMAEALSRFSSDFYFVFRRHPRDNVSYETYKRILTDVGVRVIDTQEFSTNDIGAASDVILTTWSTEGLYGLYRRKPTINIIDHNFKIEDGLELPLPPVKFGASVGIDTVSKLADVMPDILNPSSHLNQKLKIAMEKYYRTDGKNAERVANVVRQYLK